MECRDILINQGKGDSGSFAALVESDVEEARASSGKLDSKSSQIKKNSESGDKSEIERLIPNSSSLSLLFGRASNLSLQVDSFADRWTYLLAGIAKMMQAQSSELVIFEKDSRNMLLELEKK
jgi:hypothetical protein